MKTQFVADGPWRLAEGFHLKPGETLRAGPDAGVAQAGFLPCIWLYLRIRLGTASSWRPGRRPSPGTLW